MVEQPLESGAEKITKTESAGASTTGAAAFRDEALAIASAKPSLSNSGTDKAGSDTGGAAGPNSSQERRAQESAEFKNLFDKANFTLEPLQKGWGPYQALKQMQDDHKIKLTDDEILKEARRIRDRDFRQSGLNYYDSTDSIARWSGKEIGKKVQDTVKKVKGIDVSSYEDVYDWKQVKDAGYEFTFLRATKGVGLVDETFDKYRQGARDAGLAVGYFHYLFPQESIDEQVKQFVKTVGKGDKGALRLVLDAEDEKLWAPFTQAERSKKIEDWVKGVQKELGTKPSIMIYGSPSFFDEVLKNDPKLKSYELWIANYRVAEPRVPQPWNKWTFWQYNDSGIVPGVKEGHTDLDMLNGTDLSKVFKRK